jgi:hypothetical protein
MRPEHRVIKKPDAPLDLKSQGIDKNLAHRARTSKRWSDSAFEVAIRRQQQSRRTQIRKPKTAKPRVTCDVDDWAWLKANIGEEHAVHLLIGQLVGWFRRKAEAHNMPAVELLDKLLKGVNEKEFATRPPPLPGYDEIIATTKKRKAARAERRANRAAVKFGRGVRPQY